MKEISFSLQPEELIDIHRVIKKHKLIVLNSMIQPVSTELDRELYAKVYRFPYNDCDEAPSLISWVR